MHKNYVTQHCGDKGEGKKKKKKREKQKKSSLALAHRGSQPAAPCIPHGHAAASSGLTTHVVSPHTSSYNLHNLLNETFFLKKFVFSLQ